MGYGTTLLLLLVAISVSMYVIDPTNYNAIQDFNNKGFFSAQHNWVDLLVDKTTLATIAVGIVVAAVSYASFGVMYAVPAFLATVIANLIFLPIGSIMSSNVLPTPIQMLLFGFINVIFVAAVFSMIRGSEM